MSAKGEAHVRAAFCRRHAPDVVADSRRPGPLCLIGAATDGRGRLSASLSTTYAKKAAACSTGSGRHGYSWRRHRAAPVKRNENNLEVQVKGRGDLRPGRKHLACAPERPNKNRLSRQAGRKETTAKLDLKLVPPPNGNTFILMFLGAPPLKAEVTLSKRQKPTTADGLIPGMFREQLITPVSTHLCVDEILVDSGEFLAQYIVQYLGDIRIAFDGSLLPFWALCKRAIVK